MSVSSNIPLRTESIPVFSVVRAGALFVLEILQQRGFYTYMEIVRLVRSDRDEIATHAPAVHVARNAATHVGQPLCIEVVACRECKDPVFCRLYVSRKTQVLRYPSVIFHFLLVMYIS